MDDILYILLGVAVFAYNIYRAAKKKQILLEKKIAPQQQTQQTQQTQQKPKQPDFFGTIEKAIKEQYLDTYSPNPEPIDTYNPQSGNLDSYTPNEEYIDTYKEPIKPYSVEFDDTKRKQSPVFVAKNVDYSNDKKVNIDFDLKKAILFSEILKPKYF